MCVCVCTRVCASVLIQIAYRLFITRGYEHTSVDEIIAEAGIAKGTYYYYFESKEQMLEDVIGMMLQAEAEKAEAVLGAGLGQGCRGPPGAGTDLSEVALLGVLQSEFREAMEMMDICL